MANDIIIPGRESPLNAQVMALPLYFCDPIIIGLHANHVGNADATIFTASGTYLEIDGRKLLVTNAHVIRKYEEEYAIDKRTTLQLSDVTRIDIKTSLIDIDDKSDLATLDLSGVHLHKRDCTRAELQPRQFYKPIFWPPESVHEGDVVAYAGWPGILRHDAADKREIEHNPYSIIAVSVTLAMPDRFTVKLDRSDLTYAFGRAGPDEKDYDFGGMSGSPVLRKGPIAYELVGFISEYQRMADTFVITSASNIKRSARLWHNTSR